LQQHLFGNDYYNLITAECKALFEFNLSQIDSYKVLHRSHFQEVMLHGFLVR
jgi:hypothetical protein